MTREEALKIVRENYPHFGTTEPWLDLEKAMALLPPNPIITYKGEKVTRVCLTIILDKSTMEINFLMQ